MSNYVVYMIRCEDNTIYTGITTDVERRFKEHQEGGSKGAKYTRVHRPLKIEKVIDAKDRSEASKLEHKIKRMTKEEKEIYIKRDTD